MEFFTNDPPPPSPPPLPICHLISTEPSGSLKNKAGKTRPGYTAVRCVPRVIAPSLVAPSFITPFLAPFIPSYHFPSPSKIPGGFNGRKGAFLLIQKNGLRTDRQTEERKNGRTDRRTGRPSYRDARLHLKKDQRKRGKGKMITR